MNALNTVRKAANSEAELDKTEGVSYPNAERRAALARLVLDLIEGRLTLKGKILDIAFSKALERCAREIGDDT